MSTPLRISGSPPLGRSGASAPRTDPLRCCVVTSLPVIIRPHVAAFTNSDGAWPMCDFQSPLLILSRISASRVARSGMRSSASARHISATPSWLDSENSWINPSTPPPELFARSASTSFVASFSVSAATVAGRRAWPIRNGTHSGSGPAIRGRDRRAQHGLRLHVLREIEERMRRAVFVAIDGRGIGQFGRTVRARQFGRKLTVLDALQISEDRLLDQPVWSALEARRGIFEPGTQQIVDFDA